ncbi:hypothetical protein C1646_747526 [Rhizophagus diaphanus]|nr:hypothetical protein C1646_747526 [Rhizophagus diaphanus] [Rhizophagus sp. MUCL 43196]
MSCSKIFSGELPELTYDILKYFKNDFSTLHSCILVNRLWCRLAIPLLWENPFSNPTGNYNFIEIYLNNLNGDLKTELNEYRIEDNLFPSNTLFNYPSLIKPFKLKSLFINSRSHIDDSSFQLLLRKYGGYLENFGGNFGVQSKVLLESIIKYCKNIKSIYLSEFKDQIIYLLFDLIENMKQSLNYLTISVSGCENYIECSSIVLQNLGQILPFKLEYLDLVLHIKMSDFEIFLKNSQNTFIKKLLINNFNNLKGQDILPYIKEYIMKKKRVKYLAFKYSFESTSDESDDENCDEKELALMKDEVEEFKLYDIKVLRLYGSWISFYEFTIL